MSFNLTHDLVFFDVETTGLNVLRDRILQLAMVKYPAAGGEPIEWCKLINPGYPISDESAAIHGITAADLATEPTFGTLAKEIMDFIKDADLAGYNSNRFDLPMLMEEFARVGMELDISKKRLIDVQRIFYKMEPRTLSAAYRMYCGQEMVNAHDALADVRATAAVLKGQIDRYEGQDLNDEEGNLVPQPIKNNMQVLHEFVNDLRFADATQRLKYTNEGVLVFNFGKYQDRPVVEVFTKEPSYYHWMQDKDFSSQVKQLLRVVWEGMRKN
jgi:DNA polymerase III subunit epsilon